MKPVILSLGVCTVLALTACNKQESYTADYLYANDDIRAKVLADCTANKQSQENCTAANDAENKKKVDDFNKRLTSTN